MSDLKLNKTATELLIQLLERLVEKLDDIDAKLMCIREVKVSHEHSKKFKDEKTN